MVGHSMDDIWRHELCKEAGYDVRQKDNSFRYLRTHEVQGSRQDDHVKNVVDEACKK